MRHAGQQQQQQQQPHAAGGATPLASTAANVSTRAWHAVEEGGRGTGGMTTCGGTSVGGAGAVVPPAHRPHPDEAQRMVPPPLAGSARTPLSLLLLRCGGGSSVGWRARVVRCALAVFPLVLLVGDRWVGLGWLALLYGCALCVLDGSPSRHLLSAGVDGELLLFFAALFVCVGGFNATGVPGAAWAALPGAAHVGAPAGAALFTGVVVLGSNVVSNVPLVLLLAPQLAQLAPGERPLAWALLAWVATVAGNLTLLGSVANLIVAARARGAYELRFTEHLRVGLPSTLLVVTLGTPLVWALAGGSGGGGSGR